MMFLTRFITGKRERKVRTAGSDQIEQQVKKVLENTNQKLILMVRG